MAMPAPPGSTALPSGLGRHHRLHRPGFGLKRLRCAIFNYINIQIGYDWNQIEQAGAPTLAQTYTTLTGKTDGWTVFRQQLDNNFPLGTPSGLTTDNPYPLPMDGYVSKPMRSQELFTATDEVREGHSQAPGEVP